MLYRIFIKCQLKLKDSFYLEWYSWNILLQFVFNSKLWKAMSKINEQRKTKTPPPNPTTEKNLRSLATITLGGIDIRIVYKFQACSVSELAFPFVSQQ